MTLGPDPVGLEAKLDAMGRSLATEAPEPAEFVGMVRRRRRWIAVRRAGAGACGVLALALVVMVAQHHGAGRHDDVAARGGGSPTFSTLRTVEDVDRAPQMATHNVPAPPMARAGERPDSEVARELSEFK
jgi:hypothetical protein